MADQQDQSFLLLRRAAQCVFGSLFRLDLCWHARCSSGECPAVVWTGGLSRHGGQSVQDPWCLWPWARRRIQWLGIKMDLSVTLDNPAYRCGSTGFNRRGKIVERGSCILWLVLLPEQVLRGSGHGNHLSKGEKKLHTSDLPPCWRNDVHVGWYSLHVTSDMDVRLCEFRDSHSDGTHLPLHLLHY